MMNFQEINDIVQELSILPYYPREEAAHAAVVRIVGQMATTPEQVRWLVNRMTSGLYSEWPGPGELRACFCSKFKPADGIERHSSVYPDGIPSEKTRQSPAQIDYARHKQIEAGSQVSASPSLQRSVRLLAAALDLNTIGRKPAVPEIPLRQLKPEEMITAVDVEREEKRRCDERARKELGI